MIEPLEMPFISDANAARFWGKVILSDQESCWLWNGNTNNRYGFFMGRRPHRVAWFLTHGTIPKGLEVIHKCDVPLCVNPSHLLLGTHKQNMEDMSRKGRVVTYRGSENGNSKLTQDDVNYIRATYIRGDGCRGRPGSVTILSEKFGVNKSTILDIANHVMWK